MSREQGGLTSTSLALRCNEHPEHGTMYYIILSFFWSLYPPKISLFAVIRTTCVDVLAELCVGFEMAVHSWGEATNLKRRWKGGIAIV